MFCPCHTCRLADKPSFCQSRRWLARLCTDSPSCDVALWSRSACTGTMRHRWSDPQAPSQCNFHSLLIKRPKSFTTVMQKPSHQTPRQPFFCRSTQCTFAKLHRFFIRVYLTTANRCCQRRAQLHLSYMKTEFRLCVSSHLPAPSNRIFVNMFQPGARVPLNVLSSLRLFPANSCSADTVAIYLDRNLSQCNAP